MPRDVRTVLPIVLFAAIVTMIEAYIFLWLVPLAFQAPLQMYHIREANWDGFDDLFNINKGELQLPYAINRLYDIAQLIHDQPLVLALLFLTILFTLLMTEHRKRLAMAFGLLAALTLQAVLTIGWMLAPFYNIVGVTQ